MTDLNLLRSFLAAYRTGSMTRAAQQLHLSQPAVTAHIQLLEQQTGEPLFVRVPRRGVSPTARGEALARAVGAHLDALEAATGILGLGGEPALVSIGGPPDLLALAVVPAVLDLVRQGVRIRSRSGGASATLDNLRAGRIDAAVVPGGVGEAGLEEHWLFDERFVLVGSPDFAQQLTQTALDEHRCDALESVPLVAYDESLPLISLYCRKVFGRKPNAMAALVVDDLRAVTTAVRAGLGVTVLPHYHAGDGLAQGDLVELHRPSRPPSDQVSLVHRPTADGQLLLQVVEAIRRRPPGIATA